MPLIGTAGHVDHGKSSLIQRLTGRDPDRWDEEKRRGLTIDLGFAWTHLPSGVEVSFVDVPGHERYLKNMLAGIETIDIALFVVAADEGWMPQSEEHLAVLDLLGVDKGLVALTKADLVDDDLAELAAAEVEENLAGTSLQDCPIIPVSKTTGEGVADITGRLDELVADVETPDVGRPRLWVDRVFTASGAGTIVTGTLLDGTLAVDQTVIVYPSRLEARIRGLQSHETSDSRLGPGRRVALNLGGVAHTDVARGDMIGLEGQWATTKRFLATLRMARYVDDFSKKGAFHLHLGSGAQRAEVTAWDGTNALIRTDQPIVTKTGDRFVLRDTGRRLVTAGGIVLDPDPGPSERALAAAIEIDPGFSPDEMATCLLMIRGSESQVRLDAHTGGGRPPEELRIGDLYMSESVFDELSTLTLRLVKEEHERYPLRVGIPLATLGERLGVTQEITEAVVDQNPEVKRVGADVSTMDHRLVLLPDQEAAWDRAKRLLDDGLDVPDESELELDAELIHFLIRQGELVRLAPGLVMLPAQIEEVRRILSDMDGEFTVSQFRDAAGLSRKYAVPILEWSDKEGLTVRRGDTRTVR